MTPIEKAWDRVFAAFDLGAKPRNESVLGLARDGHPNAIAIVENELSDVDCPSCGSLENCPAATSSDFEKREALRALMVLLGRPPPA